MLDILKNGRGQILKLFFQNTEKEYYLTEIADNIGRKPGAIQFYLESLVKEGILIDQRKGNLRLFTLNKEYPLYNEIKTIISKTVGIEYTLKELIKDFNEIECSFIFGSIAKDKENNLSDIDLMIIGEVNEDKLIIKIDEAESFLKRIINYHVYSKGEFVKKLQEKNDFITKILSEQKIILKGNPDAFNIIS